MDISYVRERTFIMDSFVLHSSEVRGSVSNLLPRYKKQSENLDWGAMERKKRWVPVETLVVCREGGSQ